MPDDENREVKAFRDEFHSEAYRTKMAERRKRVYQMVLNGIAPSEIADTLFADPEARLLFPSETRKAAFDLVKKDISVMFASIKEARISSLPAVARELHATRWKRIYQKQMEIVDDPTERYSEVYKATALKNAMEALKMWGKLEGVDADLIAKRGSSGATNEVETWEVEVGDQGLPVTRQIRAADDDLDIIDLEPVKGDTN